MVLHVLPNIASADHRAHLDRHGRHHPDRGGARLPRPGRAAADARMGPHDRRIARVPARGAGGTRPAPGLAIFARGHGLQPAGRRAARLPRPAHAAGRRRDADGAAGGRRTCRVGFATEGGFARVLDRRQPVDRRGRGHGPGRRKRLRQDHAGARHPRRPAAPTRAIDGGRIVFRRRGPAARRPPRSSTDDARPRHHLHPAGPVHLASTRSSRVGDADHGADALEVAARRRAPARTLPAIWRAIPRGGATASATLVLDAARRAAARPDAACCASTRTSSPAASASG